MARKSQSPSHLLHAISLGLKWPMPVQGTGTQGCWARQAEGVAHLSIRAFFSLASSARVHSALCSCPSRVSQWACSCSTLASSACSCSAWALFTAASTVSFSLASRSSSSCLEYREGPHRGSLSALESPKCLPSVLTLQDPQQDAGFTGVTWGWACSSYVSSYS